MPSYSTLDVPGSRHRFAAADEEALLRVAVWNWYHHESQKREEGRPPPDCTTVKGEFDRLAQEGPAALGAALAEPPFTKHNKHMPAGIGGGQKSALDHWRQQMKPAMREGKTPPHLEAPRMVEVAQEQMAAIVEEKETEAEEQQQAKQEKAEKKRRTVAEKKAKQQAERERHQQGAKRQAEEAKR